jgi:transposase
MTKTQVEVITSVQQRWRWSRAEKERIVAAALEPGMVASEVARSRDTCPPAIPVAARALQANDVGARHVRPGGSGAVPDTEHHLRQFHRQNKPARVEIQFAAGGRMWMSMRRRYRWCSSRWPRPSGADDPRSYRRAGVVGHEKHDMRKGFASLSLRVQEVLRRDQLRGHRFCFRGRRGDLLKVIWVAAAPSSSSAWPSCPDGLLRLRSARPQSGTIDAVWWPERRMLVWAADEVPFAAWRRQTARSPELGRDRPRGPGIKNQSEILKSGCAAMGLELGSQPLRLV